MKLRTGYTIPYTPFEYWKFNQQLLTSPSYDIFGLGIIIFEVLFEGNMFPGSMNEKAVQMIREEGKNLQNNPNFYKNYEKLLLSNLILAP